MANASRWCALVVRSCVAVADHRAARSLHAPCNRAYHVTSFVTAGDISLLLWANVCVYGESLRTCCSRNEHSARVRGAAAAAAAAAAAVAAVARSTHRLWHLTRFFCRFAQRRAHVRDTSALMLVSACVHGVCMVNRCRRIVHSLRSARACALTHRARERACCRACASTRCAL